MLLMTGRMLAGDLGQRASDGSLSSAHLGLSPVSMTDSSIPYLRASLFLSQVEFLSSGSQTHGLVSRGTPVDAVRVEARILDEKVFS